VHEEQGDLVSVFIPTKRISASHVRCCVMVLHDRELVLAAATASLEPLMELAHDNFKISEHMNGFVKEHSAAFPSVAALAASR
jgi:hypothetical protein